MFKLVVLACAVAVASATGAWPLGIAGPLGGHLGLGALGVGPLGLAGIGHLGVPAAVPAAHLGVAWGAPVLGAYNYRGPLSLAPGQPANILAADGRPLDTLSVNLDRAAHITAQAVNGHVLKKRSAPILAGIHGPVAVSHTSRIDLPGRLIAPVGLGHVGLAGPVGLAAPGHLGWGAPVAAPLGLGLGPWGLRGLGHVW